VLPGVDGFSGVGVLAEAGVLAAVLPGVPCVLAGLNEPVLAVSPIVGVLPGDGVVTGDVPAGAGAGADVPGAPPPP